MCIWEVVGFNILKMGFSDVHEFVHDDELPVWVIVSAFGALDTIRGVSQVDL